MRSMKKKLASCSNKGTLTFDKSLLEEPEKMGNSRPVLTGGCLSQF